MVQKDLGQCCLCFPLQLGCTLICTWSFVYSLLCMYALFVDDPRLQPGGYNPATSKTSVVVGIFGVLFGMIGVLGVYDSKPAWIRWYNFYQFIRIVTALFVFTLDLIMLRQCEGWVKDIKSQIEYNISMESVSVLGICGMARSSYIVGFCVDFGLNLYWFYVTYCYAALLERNPAFLIKFDSGFVPTLPTRALGEPAQWLKKDDNYGTQETA